MNSGKSSTNFPLFKIGIVLSLTLSCLWLIQDYFASFLCLLIPMLALTLMAISFVAEFFEKSNLPTWYYRLMWILVLIPLALLFIFGRFSHLQLDWTRIH
ncbi:MAG: hypothetical protein V9E90_02100 [Saprospiraceae bacterium]|jgi:hypothetical protein